MTHDELEALRVEALEAGDQITADACCHAMLGNAASLAFCVAVVEDAKANDDDEGEA